MAVSTGGQDDDVMSTINITPFTDVLLVLLIIFIILASVTKEPKLPDAKNKEQVAASQIIVIINDKNDIQIGSTGFPSIRRTTPSRRCKMRRTTGSRVSSSKPIPRRATA